MTTDHIHLIILALTIMNSVYLFIVKRLYTEIMTIREKVNELSEDLASMRAEVASISRDVHGRLKTL